MPRVIVALLVLASALGTAGGPAQAAAPFSDVSPNDPAYTAISALYDRGIIKGYQEGTCQDKGVAAPCFGPGDKSLRAQMAALIARSASWDAEDRGNTFTDQCDPPGPYDPNKNCIDPTLWRNVGTLQARAVARGFGDGTYQPRGLVLKQQVILFISRAKQQTGEWTLQPDNTRLYPGSAASTADHQDIVTYVTYAGAPPDAPTTLGAAWGEYASEATRGWFARALWQTYAAGKGAPVTEPTAGGWTRPTDGDSWLTAINAYRKLAGLQGVTEDASQSAGCAKHANYIVRTGTLEHDENTNSPFFTPEGQAAAKTSNLGAGSGAPPSQRGIVEGFAGSVFHAFGVFASRLQTSGYGVFSDPASQTNFTYGTCLNVIAGQTGTATYPVMFPATNGVQPFLTGKVGGEYPNPLSPCNGYSAPVGGVVLLQVQDTIASSSGTLKSAGGATLESCVYDGTNYTNTDSAAQNTGRSVMAGYHAVALIPRQPLTASTAYNVSFTVNGTNYAWSFTTAASDQAVP